MTERRGNLLIALGAACIALALALLLHNLGEERRAGAAAEAVLPALEEALAQRAESAALPESAPETQPAEEPVAEIDGVRYLGTLSIPVLALELPVRAEWSYPALRESPCRYAGTAAEGGLCIAAHNFRRHFGAIGALRPGDEVCFTDADGQLHRYTVALVETLYPTAVEEMRSSDWALTLFTCTYGGASRVTVRCIPAE